MMIYNNVSELIGNTPLLSLKNYCKAESIKGEIIAKLELFNPAGSAKDRVAHYMILEAEKKGLLKPGSVIIEPTSGNTGIGLACVGVSKGYRVILTMPDTMSVERINLIRAYGAEVVLTDGALGMAGAIAKANELANELDGFIPGQFENPANPKAHYETTGPEVWRDTNGKIDVFVACIGTGGTLSGVGKYLKEKNPDIKIIGVEPFESPLITKGVAGPHKIQGIGANFVPDTLDKTVYDEIITVKGDDAISTGNKISKTEGVLVGISSGAAVFAATEIAGRECMQGKKIVVLLPDTGEHYLSTDMFK
ncbi:MAG: cysteine synthase A [Clostridia bacterium]|nr:cysteine synthase A [Clostridia bacterium]